MECHQWALIDTSVTLVNSGGCLPFLRKELVGCLFVLELGVNLVFFYYYLVCGYVLLVIFFWVDEDGCIFFAAGRAAK